MSELQTGLLVISAVIVIAVLAYNKIEQLRLRRSTEAAFASAHDDVLLQPQQTEKATAEFSVDPPVGERIEHTLGDYAMPVAEEGESRPRTQGSVQALPGAPLYAHTDFIITMELPRNIEGDAIAQHAQTLGEANLSKPVHWEGFDAASQNWQALRASHAYRQVRVGLQLANRSGPADEDELIVFLASVRDIAEVLGARMEADRVDQAKQAALALDAFCADHDIQIGLSVLGREGQTLQGTKIRALAEANGCMLGRDGRFHKLNEQGVMLYALSNSEPMPFHAETLKNLNTRGIGLVLDVPRAPGTPATFRAYIEFARQLAQALGGVLVDDERKPLSETSIEQIAAQLDAIHHAMAVRGIHAGSALALRLFA